LRDRSCLRRAAGRGDVSSWTACRWRRTGRCWCFAVSGASLCNGGYINIWWTFVAHICSDVFARLHSSQADPSVLGMGIKRRQSQTSTDPRNCLLFTSIRNSRNIKIISKQMC
jgi:hypothetical protein